MHFGRKLISAISFSTLLVASNGHAETAPFFNDEEEIRELYSCPCSFSDLIGSDFSCTYYSSTYSMGIPNFGEDQSVCTQYLVADGSISRTYTFVETTSSRATYTASGGSIYFQLDPTQAENGECSVSKGIFSFGCWVCPTTSPTLVPTDSPSVQPSDQPSVQSSDQPSDQPSENVNPTDDEENNDENDEECWIFTLFSLLENLFLIEN